MELELRLGAPSRSLETTLALRGGRPSISLKLGFCILEEEKVDEEPHRESEVEGRRGCTDPQVQLNLLPAHPLLGFSWEMKNASLEATERGLDVNRAPSAEAAMPSSTSSPASSDKINYACGEVGGAAAADAERSSSRLSDDEENGGSRKKLRLSKAQSAFLEESFKEHSNLNPKHKIALAKQLNLRPRQVEVWFQNRRARTKLKQTEVDCEYLKRCCEALTEENRRLQKELSELRALKASHPFYMQLPATTLSMCAACERASKSSAISAAVTSATAAAGGGVVASGKSAPFAKLFFKSRLHPLTNPTAPAKQPSAAS